MKGSLEEILESVPNEVQWTDIVEFDEFNLRMDTVGVLFANTIGVADQYMEFCPDNTPPLKEEILSWIWACRPDLGKEIVNQGISKGLRILIESYANQDMDRFWQYTK